MDLLLPCPGKGFCGVGVEVLVKLQTATSRRRRAEDDEQKTTSRGYNFSLCCTLNSQIPVQGKVR
jgi:hypothetical protein